MKKYLLLICAISIALLSSLIPFSTAYGKGETHISKEINNLNGYSSRSAYVMDYNTGTTLYERNADAKYPIASMVKIMTLNVIFEKIQNGNLKFDEKVLISENASGMGGSQMFLDTGLEYTVSDLIKGIVVVSANDACVAMAEKICGSSSAFVDLMNEKTKDYGLQNTNFVNVTGLPENGQYSTAKDVSKMMQKLLKHSKYHEYSTIFLENFNHPDGRVTEFTNTNKLVKFYPGCDGGKTGFTNEAMYCLSATAKREDTRVIATVMGAQTSKERNKEVTDLLNYAFHNYKTIKTLEKGKPIDAEINVKSAKENKIEVATERDFYVLSKKGKTDEYSYEIVISDNLKAPIKKGERIGKIVVKNKSSGNTIEEIGLITLCDIDKISLLDSLKLIAENWSLKV